MTTKSGTNNVQPTAFEIISSALRKCGATDAEEGPQGFEVDQAIFDLNLILKAHQNKLHLWKRERIIVFTRLNTRRYLIGPGGDETCREDDFIPTSISVNAVGGSTTLNVDTSKDMKGANNVIGNGGPNFVNTAGWQANAFATIAVIGGLFQVTNTGVTAGAADQDFATVIDRTYVVQVSYVQGTSLSAIFSILDSSPAVLDSVTLSASGSAEISFTATTVVTTFRFTNGTVTAAEDNSISFVKVLDTTTGDLIGTEVDSDTTTNLMPNPGNPFTSTANFGTIDGTISLVGSNVRLTNAGNAPSLLSQFVSVQVGRTYNFSYGFVLGTAATVTVTIIDGDSQRILSFTPTSTTTLTGQFVATTTQVNIVMLNETFTTGEFSEVSSISVIDANVSVYREWSKILEIPSPSTIRIVDALTALSSVGNTIYTFSELADRPLRSLNEARYQLEPLRNNEPEPMATRLSRQEYDAQSIKDITGPVTNVYFNPSIIEREDTLTGNPNRNSELFTWPISNNVRQIVKLSTLDPIDDINDSGDLIDMPVEWVNAIVWTLSDQLKEEYGGISAEKSARITFLAEKYMKLAKSTDQDRRPIRLIAKRTRY